MMSSRFWIIFSFISFCFVSCMQRQANEPLEGAESGLERAKTGQKSRVPVSANANCSRYFNEWGHASTCTCSSKYQYDPKVGDCALASLEIPVAANAKCTRDLNSWGFPSSCDCPAGYNYNPQARTCKQLPDTKGVTGTSCTRDFNQWGRPTKCTCPGSKSYNGQTGLCE